MCSERDIDFLLNLYEKEYVKGEIRSKETKKKMRYESKRKNRHLIFDELRNKADTINLSPNQVKVIRYIIDDFNEDFKNLHRKASEETIILAFIFYVKKIEKPSIRLESYRICREYGLSNHVFEIIVCRMLLKFMKKCPIRPTINYSKDHDQLLREGLR